MNIKISDEYRLTSDNKQIILEKKFITRKGENKGKEYYRQIRFYPNLEIAFNDILDLKILLSDCDSFEKLIKEIRNIRRMISEKLEKI